MSRINTAEAFRVLAAGAMSRLQKGLTLLKMGTNAAGLVPQPGLSRGRRTAFGALLVCAVALCAAAVVRGYQTPQVPALPSVAQRPPAAAAPAPAAPAAVSPGADGGSVQVGVQVVNRPAVRR